MDLPEAMSKQAPYCVICCILYRDLDSRMLVTDHLEKDILMMLWISREKVLIWDRKTSHRKMVLNVSNLFWKIILSCIKGQTAAKENEWKYSSFLSWYFIYVWETVSAERPFDRLHCQFQTGGVRKNWCRKTWGEKLIEALSYLQLLNFGDVSQPFFFFSTTQLWMK